MTKAYPHKHQSDCKIPGVNMPHPLTWVPNLEDVIVAIKENIGNLRAVAKHFGVSHIAMYSLMDRHPELKPIIDNARETGRNVLLDKAERNMSYYINDPEHAKAYNASTYVLDKLGHERKWGKQADAPHQQVESGLQKLSEWTKDAHKEIKDDK
jgi:hypothetical protein